jgi:flagellar protein FlaF
MGFSVSGSAAIIFAGMFISFGIAYGAVSDSFERVTDARQANADHVLESSNADVEITGTEYVGDRLTVFVNNTGATELSVNGTDFLVDNAYQLGWAGAARVNGVAATDLWLPGERLNVTIRTPEAPDRVKIVSGPGVADVAAGVT